jgi:esterase/lipase
MGTPVHIKSHFWAWIGSRLGPFIFKKYAHKTYPKKTINAVPSNHSYTYFSLRSVKECLRAIRKSAMNLNKVTVPVLIVQTNSDYLVTKYSPWIIFNRIKSKIKKLQWIQSKYDSHTLTKEETKDFFSVIQNFLLELEDKK